MFDSLSLKVPYIDITLPINALEYPPARARTKHKSARGRNDTDDRFCASGEGNPPRLCCGEYCGSGDDDGSLECSGHGDHAAPGMLLLAEKNPVELLHPAQAAKVVVLLEHARTCPGNHQSEAHTEVCESAKFLMLHIRDCCGTAADGGACAFSWCRPCMSLAVHLLVCPEPGLCAICSPSDLSQAMSELRAVTASIPGISD